METAKRQALTLIQNLPDDSTLEDIQYHLYVREKVQRGLTDLKSRRTVSQRQTEERDSPYYAASFVSEIRSHARRLSRFKTFEGSGHVWHLVFGARRSNLTNLDNFISLK